MLQSIFVLDMDVQVPRVNDVFKVLDLVGEARALFQFQGHPGLAESVQDRVNVLHELFRVGGEDIDIIQVDEA